MAWIEERE